MKRLLLALAIALATISQAQAAPALTQDDVPGIYKNIVIRDGQPFAMVDGKTLPLIADANTPDYTVWQLRGDPKGCDQGFRFDFSDAGTSHSPAGGVLFYSLWNPTESRFPTPHYKFSSPIGADNSATVPMDSLAGKYDLDGWEAAGRGILYYRVQGADGSILYEGKFFFTTNPYAVATSMVDGPFATKVTDTTATISFETNDPVAGQVRVGDKVFTSAKTCTRQEIELTGLAPDRVVTYTAVAGKHEETYAFRTAPAPGSRKPFVFAYSSDSRSSIASGERDANGPNAYVLKKIMALATAKSARFMQFTGDTMSGYDSNVPMQRVKYASYRRATLPFASRLPIHTGMGNHETIEFSFDDGSKYGLNCDRFPFATDSAEAVFADVFENPDNGPVSEDGTRFDPNPGKPGDYPPYRENVFSYTWDNVAMVVLNSQYAYSTAIPGKPWIGGNLWGYIMDNQMAWLQKTLDTFEADPNIDHVFVTQHTPTFPNGGHVSGYNSMWMKGLNLKPVINGIDADSLPGSIDRRDEYLRILLAHKKVKAILVGDEHNYSRLLIQPGMPLYKPGGYVPEKPLTITRDLWHICVGSAGAPYYYTEEAPWNAGFPQDTTYLKHFTPQHAVAFFHVDGKKLKLEVVDPVTLDRIE